MIFYKYEPATRDQNLVSVKHSMDLKPNPSKKTKQKMTLVVFVALFCVIMSDNVKGTESHHPALITEQYSGNIAKIKQIEQIEIDIKIKYDEVFYRLFYGQPRKHHPLMIELIQNMEESLIKVGAIQKDPGRLKSFFKSNEFETFESIVNYKDFDTYYLLPSNDINETQKFFRSLLNLANTKFAFFCTKKKKNIKIVQLTLQIKIINL